MEEKTTCSKNYLKLNDKIAYILVLPVDAEILELLHELTSRNFLVKLNCFCFERFNHFFILFNCIFSLNYVIVP